MIADVFLYAGERDMLELRCRTLREVVDVFIPVFSTLTHQGEEWAWQAAWNDAADTVDGIVDRIGREIFVAPYRVDPRPLPRGERGGAGTPWYQHIERQHRHGMLDAVRAVTDDNIVVVVSDVDEIPDPAAFETLPATCTVWPWVLFAQRFHSTYIDWLHPHQPWLGPIAALRSTIEGAGYNGQAMRDLRGPIATGDERGYVETDGGWHFSWFGTDAERQQKLDSFSHAELRDRFDPILGRSLGVHSNGELLRQMTLEELAAGPWPQPINDRTFTVPESWESPDLRVL